MVTESRVPDHIDRQILHALHLSPRAPFARVASVIGVVVGYRETRGQAAYLRSWIEGRLSTPWISNPPR